MKTRLLLIATLCLATLLGTAQYNKILDFKNATGSNPNADLISDGTFLYGTAQSGGILGYGTIFKIKPNGTGYTQLHNFNSTKGSYPMGSLVSDGTSLYGMTSNGGSHGSGVLFKINPNGTGYTVLINFAGASTGSQPNGSLIYDGTYFYGMTFAGGATNDGTIFKMQHDSSDYVKLMDYSSATSGQYPRGTPYSDGTYLYAMTQRGGVNGDGTIIKIKTDGTGYAKLLDFNNTNGYNNYGGSFVSDGTYLYGMTQGGGAYTLGVIFKIKKNGTGYVDLLDFANASNGSSPNGSLIYDGTNLYGMTSGGGANGLGVLFKIKTDGSGDSTLLDFNGAVNGSYPSGSLLFLNGSFYGLTVGGGANTAGTLFKYNTLKMDSIKASNVSCNGLNNGSATAYASGVLTGYTYSWNTTLPQTGQTATGLSAGTYKVTITDANNTTVVDSVTVTQPSAISFSASSTNASCYNNDGTATITHPTGGTAPYSYLWSNLATGQSISSLAGGTYSITVTDNLGCVSTQQTTVSNSATLTAPSICEVTVDSMSKYNVIIWTKVANAPIKNYLIYRDTANNAYGLIGTVPYAALSQFTDTVRKKYAANGDPNASSWKYKIAVMDTCGNISPMSPYHKTLFTQNNTGNFSWNDYTIEGQVVPVPALVNYLFQRDNISNGNWVTIQTLSASSTAYTDLLYSTFPTGSWRVETNWGISCTPTFKVNGANTINSSRSNIRNNLSVSGIASTESFKINTYPNPANNLLNIVLPNDGSMYTTELANILGERIVFTQLQGANAQLDLSNVAAGVYYLKVSGVKNSMTSSQKIVVTK